MPPSEGATANTPLAPSVEKAYYRKCIELKRRLNEVEAANDEYKIKRVRLDRAVMKMRLERAFLLDQLSKRMENNPDGSEGSADEGMATPPPDRPHRDKRRRPQHIVPAPGPTAVSSSHSHHAPPYPQHSMPQFHRTPSDLVTAGPPPMVLGPAGIMVPANAITGDGQYIYLPPSEHMHQHTHPHPHPHPPPPVGYPPGSAALSHSSPYGVPVGIPGSIRGRTNGMGFDGADEREHDLPNDHDAEVGVREGSHEDRRGLAPSPVVDNHTAAEDLARQAGFTAVNQ